MTNIAKEIAATVAATAVVTLTEAQQTVFDTLPTTSAKIRFMDSEGYTRSQIAKYLDKRYQHVREVLLRPLKKVA